jgi:hypothetical protein
VSIDLRGNFCRQEWKMTKKEKNEQRHKMAVAIFREMTSDRQEVFIEENRKKHTLMCANRKTFQEHHREMLKAGREFVAKNGVMMFYGHIGGYALSAGAVLHTIRTPGTSEERINERVAYRIAYTICSPKDTPSIRAAKGYAGWRLMEQEEQHPYVFFINMSHSGALIPERLAQLIRLHIELDIVTKRVTVPAKLQRFVLRGHADSSLSPAPNIPKTSRKRMKVATKVSPC